MRPLLMMVSLALLLAACNRLPTPKAPEFQAGDSTVVPMQLLHTGDIGGLPLVPVQMGGQQTWWVVDTGSSHNLVSPRLVQALKLGTVASSEVATIGGKRETPYYRLPDMRIGDVVLEKQSAAGLDLSLVSANDTVQVDGILGVRALNHLVVTLDFRHHQARFARHIYAHTPHSVIPFRLAGGVPVASLPVLAGRQGDFILDTGNSGGLVILPTYAQRPQPRPGSAFIEVEDLGGRMPTQLARLPFLQLGDWQAQHVPVSLPMRSHGFSGLAGSIGNAMFSGQTVTFDFPNRHLLISAPNGASTLPGGFGFMLAAGNRVEVVLPDSSAAGNGVQVGDQIVAVDGNNTANSSSHTIWRILDGKDVAHITLLRGGAPYTVMLGRGHFLPGL